VGDELRLVLDVRDEDPSVVLVIGADGTIRGRLSFPETFGADELAVDLGRRRIYLAVRSDASLLAASLPEGY
jgi:hypothetical protein